MITVYDLAFFIVCLGLLVVAILVFRHKGPTHPRYLLALFVLVFVAVLIHISLLLTGAILKVPHLYRLTSPMSYQVGGLAFLYSRAVLYQEKGFRRHDWLHFLPFLLHTTELLPFFLQSGEVKLALLQEMVARPDRFTQATEGVLPAYWHILLKGGLAALYSLAALAMIFRYRRKKGVTAAQPHQPAKVTRWLVLFNVFLLLTGAGVFFTPFFHFSESLNSQSLIFIIVGLMFLIILLILFFQPAVLYGIPERPNIEPEDTAERAPLLDEGKLNYYKSRLEGYMQREKPYLQTDLSLNKLAELTDISRHHLSACINEGFGVNFNEYVNSYRISYICHEADPQLWHRLSVDGLAEEAGFSSRFTFSKAFKKEKGMTPTSFRKTIPKH